MFGFGKKKAQGQPVLVAAVNGTSVPVTSLPDQVFSQKILGDGYAVAPADGVIVSPARGKVIDVQETRHAYGIETEDGLSLLVHIGIDTVAMNGDGFTAFVRPGDHVEAGQRLAGADLEKIQAAGLSAFVIVLITNMEAVKWLETTICDAEAGKTVLLTYER